MGFEIACTYVSVVLLQHVQFKSDGTGTPSLYCYNPNARNRLNARISAFPYAVEDIRNKPSPIAQQTMTGLDSNLKQSGMIIA